MALSHDAVPDPVLHGPYVMDFSHRVMPPPEDCNDPAFTNLYYTPVDCEHPKDFNGVANTQEEAEINHSGRQYQLLSNQAGRRIRHLVNITMYNEEAHELESTMAAISQCVGYMEQTFVKSYNVIQ